MNTFFIGDAFLTKKTALSQVDLIFGGARKLDGGLWEISVLTIIANGYAGGSSVLKWEVAPGEELMVSSSYKGYFILDSGRKQKTKEYPVKAVKFREISKDQIEVEFIE